MKLQKMSALGFIFAIDQTGFRRAITFLCHFCDRTDTVIYRVRLLQNILNVNPADEDN
jgi:hypothetical protein